MAQTVWQAFWFWDLPEGMSQNCKAVFVILPVGCEENTLSESKQGRV